MPPPYGLGALQSPPDERDYPITDLYEARGLDAAVTPPTTYLIPKLPPVYNQRDTPMCVAYSNSTEQGAFDLLDYGHNYKWDWPYFFRLIGGGPNGAIVRNALDRRLNRGYPLEPSQSGNSAMAHRIAAYYRVDRTKLAIQRAVLSFGVCLMSTPWFNSWFDPVGAAATLPSPDYQVGGHAIAVIGWTTTGLRLRNSWGTAWGADGNCVMPWPYVIGAAWEIWKAMDRIDTP